jgi:hypothetical protein
LSAVASPEVAADRERIRAICALPEATGQMRAALNVALAGATASEARVVLQLSAGALSPDELAAKINGKNRR